MRSWIVGMRGLALLILGLVAGGPRVDQAMAQEAPALPPELQLIPGDALGFLHIRVADIWAHPMSESVKKLIARAGPKAVAAFEKSMYPPLGTVESLTVIAVPPEPVAAAAAGPGGWATPTFAVVVQFREAFDKAKLLRTHLPNTTPRAVAGKTIYSTNVDGEMIGLYLPSDRTLVIGEEGQLEGFLKRGAVQRGAIRPAIATATQNAVTLAINMKAGPLPPDVLQNVPENLQPLLKADRLLLTWDIAQPTTTIATIRLAYGTVTAADEATEALKQLMGAARAGLTIPKQSLEAELDKPVDGPESLEQSAKKGAAVLGLGGINMLDDFLKTPPLKRDGTDLVARIHVDPTEASSIAIVGPVALGLVLPAVQQVRDAARRTQDQNNLKLMGLAFHNYADAQGRFPRAALFDRSGRQLLSWRVAVLPYLGEVELYKQFKINEPWDSEHNKKLIPLMPLVFASSQVPTEPGYTIYKVFQGPDTICDGPKGTRLADVTDGLSNTAMIAAAGDPVIWTKPDDLPFDLKKPLPKLTLPNGSRKIWVCLADGSVRQVDLDRWPEAELRKLIMKNDGNIIQYPDE